MNSTIYSLPDNGKEHTRLSRQRPAVSIIMPVFNAGQFLEETIQSVLQQSFQQWELLLIDDGSTDNSPTIAQHYATQYPDRIRYFEHSKHINRGQFETRLLGAKHAHANILALLDADDIWEKNYLQQHLIIWSFVQEKGAVASYGPALYWFPDDVNGTQDFVQPLPSGAPQLYMPGELLENFFLTMYATTPCTSCSLIKKDAFLESHIFQGLAMDNRLFEDQFLWWYVALHYPIAVHHNSWVRYRQHSHSFSTMTKASKDFIQEEICFLTSMKEYIEQAFPDHLLIRKGLLADWIALVPRDRHDRTLLIRHQRKVSSIWKMWEFRLSTGFHSLLRKVFRGWSFLARYFAKMLSLIKLLSPRLRVTIGIEPLSSVWGYDRGLPLLRYYTEQFLQEYAHDIQGHCLEFQEDLYTSRYGGNSVSKLDILHVDDQNPQATMIGDLTQSNDFPGDRFDCIICTYVLHVIFDLDTAVQELYRMLKPGGVLLVVVPHISMCDPGWHELWRFTEEGLLRVLAKPFGQENIIIRAYGNSLTAIGNIRGLVANEFTRTELQYHDSRFALEICARAIKVSGAISSNHEEHKNDY